MESIATRPLCLLPRYKILHLVRHAQGVHNVEAEKNREALMSDDLIDAQLSPLGWQQQANVSRLDTSVRKRRTDRKVTVLITELIQQVANLRNQFRSSGLLKRVDLVVTSPMLRTLQTAVGVFDAKEQEECLELPASSMEETVESNNQRLPILANELCRERLGIHPCDKRRSIGHYRSLFPAIDFSLIESENDNLWTADVRETHEEVASRGIKFIKWLLTRKENEIAIVSHGVFLQQTLIALGNKCYPSAKTEQIKRFANCEVRSVIIVDEKAMELDSLTGSCCGRISRGAQLPSDPAQDNNASIN